MRSLLCILTLLMVVASAMGQSLSGFIYDHTNAPVPFANVYVKNSTYGTSADDQGRYYLQFQDPGVYEIVFSAVGFEMQEAKVIIGHREDAVKNVWLSTDEQELREITVSAKRRDPAYEIIQKAIDQKEHWNHQYNSSSCTVYIKAGEVITEKEKKKRERQLKREEEEAKKEAEELEDEDVFAAEKKKREAEIKKLAGSRNMVEVQMRRHYQYPNEIKEIREGYKKFGNDYGLFYTTTNEADFNFYDNLMSMGNLNELPVVSPLHFTSVITYKFKLEEITFEDNRQLFKIKVTPRKKGNASWEGYIWVWDELFCLKRVDLELDKQGLMIFQSFHIDQEYALQEDSLTLLKRQEFDYTSKSGKRQFAGNTVVRYDEYEINPAFDKRFFRNEVAVTTQEAYDRDSTYWDEIRPEPLTEAEQRYQRVKDSIMAVQTSEVYLDSMDSVFNRVTFMDVLYEGIAFTKRKEKKYYSFSSLAGLVNFWEIGGLRLGPGAYYFQKWKNEKLIFMGTSLDIGLRNQDVKGNVLARYRYDPMHLGYVGFWAGKMFNTIVDNDALTNLFQRSNWIEEYRVNVYHTRELFNGLNSILVFQYVDRLPIDQYQFGDLTADWFGGNEPLTFQRYQTSIISLTLQYTPFQKYMTEPYRKVVLGSKWPTISAKYERGVPALLGSDINFDFVEASIFQNFKLATLGTTSYHVKGGKFINTQDLRYVDYKIFPRGDKYFFASLMQSMQIQDTTLYARDIYVQAHLVHHFNGAFTNLIPLVKRLGIHTVFGMSGLYIQESNYQYGEIFGGVERSFKANRARWRIGVYFVDAVSNYSSIEPRIKFAINRYSLRDQSWGY